MVYIILSLYVALLLMYVYEYPVMFSFMFVSFGTTIKQIVCHFLMFLSSVLIAILLRMYSILLWQEIYVALLVVTALGMLISSRAVFVLVRGFLVPHYRL